MRFLWQAAAGALAWAHLALAIELDLNSTDSIKKAAGTIAYNMVKWYDGNETGQTPGILPGPYYWWEAGAMFNSLVNYWYYTGDTTYNDITMQALQFQIGPDDDYMPPNQTKNEGNDDQMFWGYAVMSAAEYKFPNPEPSLPGWLALAQGVFNIQTSRWDAAYCGGGLRWQIFTWNTGYDYKNTPANGGYFNLAARLYAYTGNQTYADKANMVWDWMQNTVGLIGDDYSVFDGVHIVDNCTSPDHTRWTYTQGIMLNGAAVMWSMTNSTVWRERTQGLWNASSYFFTHEKIMQEGCEPVGTCDLDQQSFKGYLARFMAASTKVAPWLYDQFIPYLQASAIAAAQQCDGGDDGVTCGLKWANKTAFDGISGLGEQMSALEIIQANLIKEVTAPVSSTTGGTSQGDVTAGTGGDKDPAAPPGIITSADRAGAGVLTALVIVGVLSMTW